MASKDKKKDQGKLMVGGKKTPMKKSFVAVKKSKKSNKKMGNPRY